MLSPTGPARFGEFLYRFGESVVRTVYGPPLLQAAVELAPSNESPRRRPDKDPAHEAAVARRIDELKATIGEGGPREAAIRALLYIRLPDGAGDERGLALLRRIRDEHGGGLTLPT